MTLVILTARPFTDTDHDPDPLELHCRGRYWLAIPDAGDVLEVGTVALRVARRRFRVNGDVELELRADRLTVGELGALGFVGSVGGSSLASGEGKETIAGDAGALAGEGRNHG